LADSARKTKPKINKGTKKRQVIKLESILRIHGKNLLGDIRVFGNEFQFIIYQGLLIMDIGVTH
jgi:hypothetical protein